MNATPRPWRSGEYSSGTEITGPDGRTTCFLAVDRHDEGPAADESRANAALIVRAVNSFDAMREALEQAIARIEVANQEGNPIMSAWLPDAKAALALANGEDKS